MRTSTIPGSVQTHVINDHPSRNRGWRAPSWLAGPVVAGGPGRGWRTGRPVVRRSRDRLFARRAVPQGRPGVGNHSGYRHRDDSAGDPSYDPAHGEHEDDRQRMELDDPADHQRLEQMPLDLVLD